MRRQAMDGVPICLLVHGEGIVVLSSAATGCDHGPGIRRATCRDEASHPNQDYVTTGPSLKLRRSREKEG